MKKNKLNQDAVIRQFVEDKCFEQYSHVPDFPLEVVFSPYLGMLDAHIHSEFSELTLVTEGYGVHCIGNQSYNIRSGDVFFVRGDVPHYFRDGYGLSLVNVIFNWEKLAIPRFDLGSIAAYQALFVIDPGNDAPDRFDHRFRLENEDFNRVLEEIRALEQLLHQDPPPPGVRFKAVYQFFGILSTLFDAYERQSERETVGQSCHKLSELAAMLEHNFGAPITVQTMCRKAGMSEASLFRIFKKYYHDTPVNYLIRQRMIHAEEMLRTQPDKSIIEIAAECGFPDAAYFSRKFKEYFQAAPSLYRRKLTKE